MSCCGSSIFDYEGETGGDSSARILLGLSIMDRKDVGDDLAWWEEFNSPKKAERFSSESNANKR